jgi:penicillin-binding protein A
MSPLHGALIAASVANDGIMMEPYLVESIMDQGGTQMYQVEPRPVGPVLDPNTAADLRLLMRETVKSGTSRKAFRMLTHTRQFSDVEFGGKTGSLMGLNPAGKTDWFIGYARYKDSRIAVAAVTVHQHIWRVKSSQLASEFFKGYLNDVKNRERTTAQFK